MAIDSLIKVISDDANKYKHLTLKPDLYVPFP